MTLTFIPGKDAALEDSIHRMERQLALLGFNIEQVSWLNPVPYVWSVHIHDADCHNCFTNGKGATKSAALASALGEYFERLSCNYFFADYYLGKEIAQSEFVHYPQEKWFACNADDALPKDLLDSLLLDVYDPERVLTADDLIDCNSSNVGRGICALPFERQSDKALVHIPMNIIGNLYVSNGMAAGNSMPEARVQSLSEVLERYVKNRIISEGLCLPQIPLEILATYPHIQESVDKIEEGGFTLYLYDASLGGEFPVISVVLLNPANGGCYAAFGAHPQFEVALERTVTELLQGRNLKSLNEFPEPSFDLDEVGDHYNLETHFIDSSGTLSWMMLRQTADFDFVHWNFKGNTQEELDYLLSCFDPLDTDIYIADYQHLDVYACRIVVPSISEIYPADDLKWQNNNSGNDIRQAILSLPDDSKTQDDYAALLAHLDQVEHDDAMPVAEFIGLIADAGTPWETLRFGELKTLLALSLGDLEQAYDGLLWILDFCAQSFNAQRLAFYRALKVVLSVEMAEDPDNRLADYLPAMTALYGQEAVQQAIAHVNAEQRFAGLTVIDEDLSQLNTHQKLLSAYKKLQAAKAKYAQK